MYEVNLCSLVRGFVNSYHGWAVADQFEDSFNGEPFEEQNSNALVYIKGVVQSLISSRVLSEDATEELQEYLVDLTVFLSK